MSMLFPVYAVVYSLVYIKVTKCILLLSYMVSVYEVNRVGKSIFGFPRYILCRTNHTHTHIVIEIYCNNPFHIVGMFAFIYFPIFSVLKMIMSHPYMNKSLF